MKKIIITLSGNIGVGKTTLGKYIADHFNAVWLPENMYSSMIQHLIAKDCVNTKIIMQMAFSTMRVATLLSEILNSNSKIIVVERNLRDSVLFHEVWKEHYNLGKYDDFFNEFYMLLGNHDMENEYFENIIWLTCSIDTLVSRINKRNQISDVAHTKQLLTNLDNKYINLYNNMNYDNFNLIKYDTENIELNPEDISVFLTTIEKSIMEEANERRI